MAKATPANEVQKPTVPAPVVDDFENPNVGEIFGGSYPRLELIENEVSSVLTYRKDTKIQMESNDKEGEFEMKSVPVVESAADGKLYTLPLSAIFTKHWKEAGINAGDTLKIKRYPDATKKRGKGAGNKMKVFALKVYSRAAASA